jgi:hypothetical protein
MDLITWQGDIGERRPNAVLFMNRHNIGGLLRKAHDCTPMWPRAGRLGHLGRSTELWTAGHPPVITYSLW